MAIPVIRQGNQKDRRFEDGLRANRGLAVYRFKPGSVDEVIRKAKDGMLPIFRQQPGFRRYALVKTGDDSVISIDTWNTRQEADAVVQKAADWVKRNVAAHLVSVENYVGEVSFSEAA